jgi:hypothetical protein
MQIRTLDRTLAILATLAALTAKTLVLARTIFFVLAFILSAVLFFSQTKPRAERSQ